MLQREDWGGALSGWGLRGALGPISTVELPESSTGTREEVVRSSEGRVHLTPRDLTCRTGRGHMASLTPDPNTMEVIYYCIVI